MTLAGNFVFLFKARSVRGFGRFEAWRPSTLWAFLASYAWRGAEGAPAGGDAHTIVPTTKKAITPTITIVHLEFLNSISPPLLHQAHKLG